MYEKLLPNSPHKKWQNDIGCIKCSLCDVEFTLYNRKHHCRWCGSIICGKCSNNWHCRQEDDSYIWYRLCNRCYTDNPQLRHKCGKCYGKFYPGWLTEMYYPLADDKIKSENDIYHCQICNKLFHNMCCKYQNGSCDTCMFSK